MTNEQIEIKCRCGCSYIVQSAQPLMGPSGRVVATTPPNRTSGPLLSVAGHPAIGAAWHRSGDHCHPAVSISGTTWYWPNITMPTAQDALARAQQTIDVLTVDINEHIQSWNIVPV